MGGKQLGIGDYEQTTAKKRTKRIAVTPPADALSPQALPRCLEDPQGVEELSWALA